MRWQITKEEIRGIYRNVHSIVDKADNVPEATLARLRVKAILGHVGVPVDMQPQAAVEAEYRGCFFRRGGIAGADGDGSGCFVAGSKR